MKLYNKLGLWKKLTMQKSQSLDRVHSEAKAKSLTSEAKDEANGLTSEANRLTSEAEAKNLARAKGLTFEAKVKDLKT